MLIIAYFPGGGKTEERVGPRATYSRHARMLALAKAGALRIKVINQKGIVTYEWDEKNGVLLKRGSRNAR